MEQTAKTAYLEGYLQKTAEEEHPWRPFTVPGTDKVPGLERRQQEDGTFTGNARVTPSKVYAPLFRSDEHMRREVDRVNTARKARGMHRMDIDNPVTVTDGPAGYLSGLNSLRMPFSYGKGNYGDLMDKYLGNHRRKPAGGFRPGPLATEPTQERYDRYALGQGFRNDRAMTEFEQDPRSAKDSLFHELSHQGTLHNPDAVHPIPWNARGLSPFQRDLMVAEGKAPGDIYYGGHMESMGGIGGPATPMTDIRPSGEMVYPLEFPNEAGPVAGGLQRYSLENTGERMEDDGFNRILQTYGDMSPEELSKQNLNSDTERFFNYRNSIKGDMGRARNMPEYLQHARRLKLLEDRIKHTLPITLARNTDAYRDGYTHRTA